MPVDGRVLVWTAAAALVTGVIVGLIPAVRVSRGDVALALRGSRTGALGAGNRHEAVRASLQIVQLSLCVVLLFTTGLFVRSLWDIRHLDLGYDRDHVLAVDVSFAHPDSVPGEPVSASAPAVEERYEDLRARFSRVPGVVASSIAFGSPLSALNISRIRVPGRDSLPPGNGGIALFTNAAPGYFETVGTRILRGRGFTKDDGAGTESVVIVNKSMAEMLWPGADAMGRCVVIAVNDGACARVVGIAQDVHHTSLKEDALNQCYVPWGQNPNYVQGSVLLVREADDARGVVPAMTEALRRSVPNMRYVEIKTFEEMLDPQVRPWRVGATLFGLFGAIVVIVAAVGLFSVVSYLVTQRTHEFGVRIALGAGSRRVLSLVMARGLRTALIGAITGVAVSIAIAPFIEPLLFDNRARDPVLLVVVAASLLVVAGVASAWPAWRATRVDALIALRAL